MWAVGYLLIRPQDPRAYLNCCVYTYVGLGLPLVATVGLPPCHGHRGGPHTSAQRQRRTNAALDVALHSQATLIQHISLLIT